MGMSTHIQAFIPDTDVTYQKHKKVLVSCMEAEVSLPKETAEYFGSNEPYYDLLDEKLEIHLKENVHYTEYFDETANGFEIELSALPKGVTKLRFVNSY